MKPNILAAVGAAVLAGASAFAIAHGAQAQLRQDYPYRLTEPDKVAVQRCIDDITHGPIHADADAKDHYFRCVLDTAGIVMNKFNVWWTDAQINALQNMSFARCGISQANIVTAVRDPTYVACIRAEGQKIHESIAAVMNDYGERLMEAWMDQQCTMPQWTTSDACIQYRAEKAMHR